MTQRSDSNLVEKLRSPALVGAAKASLESGKTDGVLFFLSFDLVNSTELKSRQPQEWPGVIQTFYNAIIHLVREKIDSSIEWKKAGDEVLFYFSLASLEALPKCLYQVSEILRTTRSNIKNLGVAQGIVDLKSTIWCAHVGKKQGDETSRNLFFPEENGKYDFIGPDIDFGFRISAKSAPGVLCVDPKIVWLLQEASSSPEVDEVLSHVKIVGMEQLKGVWHGRYVPIAWYHPLIHDPEKIFPYDERCRNQLVEALVGEEANYDVGLVKKISQEQGVGDTWKAVLDNLKPFELITSESVPPDRQAEMHMVAVCVDSSGKVLCAKRSDTKRNFAGKWELGCAQLRAGTRSVLELMRDEYKATLGIDIDELISDDGNPKPIGTYSFVDAMSHRSIPGIIFVARASGVPVTTPEKHSEARWLSADEVAGIDPEKAVDGFHKRVKDAISMTSSG